MVAAKVSFMERIVPPWLRIVTEGKIEELRWKKSGSSMEKKCLTDPEPADLLYNIPEKENLNADLSSNNKSYFYTEITSCLFSLITCTSLVRLP